MLRLSTGLKCTLMAGLAGSAFFLISATSTSAQNIPNVTFKPGNAKVVEQGKAIYSRECAACHGINFEGQDNWRQRKADGRLPAPPHDASGHTWHHPDPMLFYITKYGPAALIQDNSYQSDMPAYESILSDEEIIAVLSYIKNQWPEHIRTRHDMMNKAARQAK